MVMPEASVHLYLDVSCICSHVNPVEMSVNWYVFYPGDV